MRALKCSQWLKNKHSFVSKIVGKEKKEQMDGRNKGKERGRKGRREEGRKKERQTINKY